MDIIHNGDGTTTIVEVDEANNARAFTYDDDNSSARDRAYEEAINWRNS